MNKKTYITIFVTLIVTLLILVGYYFITPNNPSDGNGTLNTFRNFFPFGGDDGFVENAPTTEGENSGENVETPVDLEKRLRKLSAEPVSGAGTLDVKAGTVVRYIEKATGHIYEVELFSPRQGRISNTTIPKAYDAIWGNNNNSLIARYLRDDDYTVDTFSLTVKETSTSTENTISGIAFPGNISDVSVFGSSVFYIEQNTSFTNGYISNFSGGNKKLIWNSPIKELNSQYVNSRTVALTTKPYEGSSGLLFFVDTSNGSSRKILGNIYGFSTYVNPTATDVLYSEVGENLQMKIYNIKNKTSEELTPSTFPEKCVWSKKDNNIFYCFVPKQSIENNYLTEWYRGNIQFDDDLWKYDIKNKSSTVVSSISIESGELMDAIKPILSENEQFLVFINKRDNSLWSLDLTK